MKSETEQAIIEIEKHLKALVNLHAMNLTHKNQNNKDFPKLFNDPFGEDSFVQSMITTVKNAYKDINTFETHKERREKKKNLEKTFNNE